MQKVVTVNVVARPSKDDGSFSELEFPVLNKYLDDGFKVISVYQIAPSPNLYCSTITFVLEK